MTIPKTYAIQAQMDQLQMPFDACFRNRSDVAASASIFASADVIGMASRADPR
jgi:hypothetical protein